MTPINREYYIYLEEMIWGISKNNLPQNSIDLKEIINLEKSIGNNKD